MFCSNCGSKLNDGAKFCPECGNRLQSQTDKEPVKIQPAGTKVYELRSCADCGSESAGCGLHLL